ncbi:MAG: gliding motility-associated C-terminal domain-containing protein [Saprospiraceae bacterium]
MKKNFTFWLLSCLLCCSTQNLLAGNTCNTATPLTTNMSLFETYSNLGTSASGVPAPDCGNYISNDFWFSVVVPPSGELNIVVQSGTMTNPAAALYSGNCFSLQQAACSEEDLCGDAAAAILQSTSLTPGATYYIRVWAVGGAPNGSFDIRVSETNAPSSVPLGLDAFVGSASQNGDCVTLTTAAPSQAGCAWTSAPDDMTQNIDKILVLNFGNINGNGADGIVIGFQRSAAGLSACEGGGGNLGAGGIGNSFFIEFDTWDNGFPMDIGDDHVSVFVNGLINNPINGPVSLNGGNIEDGQDHTIRFKWDAGTFDYEVYFDEQLVLSGNYDIVTNCLNGGTLAHWGAIASTGGAFNNHTVCPYVPESYDTGVEQTVAATICEGESYFAGGANQTTSGTYTDITNLPNGCQSVTTTDLTVLLNATETINQTVCDGSCVTVGMDSYCTTGTFVTTLTDASFRGCDSIVTLNLEVLDPQALILDNPQPTLDCNNSSLFLDGSFSTPFGGVTYQWTGPSAGCILLGENTAFPQVNCPGTYSLLVTQVLNGVVCSATTTVEVAINQIQPIADAGAPQNLDCVTGCTVLDGSGSSMGTTIVYTWSGPGIDGGNINDQNPTVCQAGTYTLAVFDLTNSCVATSSVIVTGTTLPVVDAGIDQIIDCTNPTVTLDGSGSDTGSDYDLVWTDDLGVQVGSGMTYVTNIIGTYTLVVTNTLTNCSSTDLVVVTGNSLAPLANAGPDGVLNCTMSQVILDGTSSSSGSNISYEWQDMSSVVVGNESLLTVSNSGTYTLVVTNTLTNCFAMDEVTITEDAVPPIADAGAGGTLSCTAAAITLDGSNSIPIGTANYDWFNASNTNIGSGVSIEVFSAGIYTLVVTNQVNGCSASAMVTVMQDADVPAAIANSDGILTCQNMMVSLSGNGSSTGTNITYQWVDDQGVVLGADLDLSVTDPGTYTLIVSDVSNGCSAATDVVVLEYTTLPSVAIAPVNPLTCEDNQVTLNGSNSSTGINFSYEWFDINNVSIGLGPIITVDQAGTYTLVVTNQTTMCFNSSSIVVTQDAAIPTAAIFAAIDQLDCNNESLILTIGNSNIGSEFSYAWTDGINNLGTTTEITITTPATYTLSVTNNNTGCVAEASIVITQNINSPIAIAAGGNLSCSNLTVALDGAGSSTGPMIIYEWENADGDFLSNELNHEVSLAGNYFLTVINSENGCTTTEMIVVEDNSTTVQADAGVNATLTCNLTSLTLDGSNSSTGPSISYQWITASNILLGTEITQLVNTADTFYLIVTDVNNGCSDTAFVEVMQDAALPLAEISASGILTCLDTIVVLDATNSMGIGTLSYEWLDENGDFISNLDTLITNSAGTYQLVVTDINNACSATTSFVVQEDITTPTADAGMDATISCSIPSVTLDGSNSSIGNNIAYEWRSPTGVFLSSSIMIDVTETGIYEFVVSNNNTGCTDTATVEVLQSTDTPTPIVLTPDTLTCGVNSVLLVGDNSMGQGTLTYQWENMAGQVIGATANILVNEIGTYTLTVEDVINGCSLSTSVVVSEDINSPIAAAGADGTLTCLLTNYLLDGTGSSQGMVYEYEWQDASGMMLSNDLNYEVSNAGNYTLIVTNTDNACTASSVVIVTEELSPPLIVATVSGILTCTTTQVDLNAAASQGGGMLTYEWFNPTNNFIGNEAIVSVENPGNYQVIVTDVANGCTASETVLVVENTTAPIAAIISLTDLNLSCAQNSIIVTGSSSQGIGSLSYEWSLNNVFISNAESPEVLSSGILMLTVTDDSNGCIASTTVTITQDEALPVVSIAEAEILNCLVTATQLNAIGSSTGSEFEINWTGPGVIIGGNTLIPTISQAGVFTLIITNVLNGCINSATVTVAEDIATPVTDIVTPDEFDCTTTSLVLDATSSTTGTGFNYNWTTTNGTIANGSTSLMPEITSAGIYTLTILNTDNGCSATELIEVTVSEDVISGVIFQVANPLCFGEQGSILIEEVVGGTPPYQYAIDNNTFGNSPAFNGIASGNYTISIRDALGCEYSEMVTIASVPELVIDLPRSVQIALGTSYELPTQINLLGSETDTIIWTESKTLDCIDCLNPTASPLSTTNYAVTVISNNGCILSAEITVYIDQTKAVYIPNTFSPNGDGVNDFFSVFANEKQVEEVQVLRVFSRWGEQVFEAKRIQPNVETQGWDGFFKNEQMNPGVLAYYAEILFVDGTIEIYKGDITLQR